MTLKEKLATAAIVGIPMIVICCSMLWGYDTLLGVLPKSIARLLTGIVFVVWLHWFLKDTIKDAIKEAGLKGKVRANELGCLDQCEHGPVVVVYPDAVWYTYVDRSDIDEIIEEHLRHGRIVERLRI